MVHFTLPSDRTAALLCLLLVLLVYNVHVTLSLSDDFFDQCQCEIVGGDVYFSTK